MNTYFEAAGQSHETVQSAINAAKDSAKAHGKWEIVVERNGGTPVKGKGVQGGGRTWMVGPCGEIEKTIGG